MTIKAPFKLGFRNEGQFVNAYFMPLPADRESAPLLLGSMRKTLMRSDSDIWDRWKAIMTAAFALQIKVVLGFEASMSETPAPESERSGQA